jgi:hypothetical protein
MASAVTLLSEPDVGVVLLPVAIAGEVASRIALVGSPLSSSAQPEIPEPPEQLIWQLTAPPVTFGALAIPVPSLLPFAPLVSVVYVSPDRVTAQAPLLNIAPPTISALPVVADTDADTLDPVLA